MKNIPESIAAQAATLGVNARAFYAAVQGVSITRRGNTEWSEHDREIAASAIGAFIVAGGRQP